MCFPNFSLVCCWNFFWFYFPVVSDERSQGKVSIPGPLVTALIFKANLPIAVCPCFRLSMHRFTVWRIGLFRIIRQQFWNERKTVKLTELVSALNSPKSNWVYGFNANQNLLQLIIYCYHCPIQLTQDQHLVLSEPWCLFNFYKSTTGLACCFLLLFNGLFFFYSQTRSSVPVANELMNSFTEKWFRLLIQ